jgi:protein ImuB
MRVQLSSGNNNYMSFFTLSRLQLERLQLAPSIESIGLYSDQFIAAPEGNLDFFSDQQQVDKNQLLDQLTAKLGSDALTRPYMLAEHLPEHANSTAGLAPAKPPIVAPPLSHQPLSHQPLWLMKHPIALPANRRQPFWRQPLTLLSGPERLCDNWWHSEQQRDYYLAHDPQGVRYWLFWEQNSQRWFVQGLFS